MFKMKVQTLYRAKEPSVLGFFDDYTSRMDVETKKAIINREVEK